MSYTDAYDWWFGEDDLSVAGVNRVAEWKEHPFDALECGKGLTLYRRSGGGQIDQRDAAIVLTAFACYEALQLIHLWNAPEVVREYLRTANPRISEQAVIAVRAALDAADLDMQNAAQLARAAEAKCPKLGFFARAATRAAAWSAARDYAQAAAAYQHRVAVMHAVGAALYATVAGTCDAARSVADEATNAAGVLAAEEGVILGNDHRPDLLPRGVAQATGRLAAAANIRSRFLVMIEQLFAG